MSLTTDDPILIFGLLGLFGLLILEVPRLIEDDPPLDILILILRLRLSMRLLSIR